MKPSSLMAAVPSSSSRRRYSGSVHALATTLAPLSGPTLVSYVGDDPVHRVRVDQAPFGEQLLQRLGAQRRGNAFGGSAGGHAVFSR